MDPQSMVGDRMEGHLPVMVEEVMAALSTHAGSFTIDATVGGGGHAIRILEASAPDGPLLGLDADAAAIARSTQRLRRFGARVTLRQANFEALATVAAAAGFAPVDGILLDLGLSSHQLADETRGFSFRSSGPLDLRFDPRTGQPASVLLAELDANELARILREYGEEPFAGRIARAIIRERDTAPIATADRLAGLVARATPVPRHARRIHPATRTFQALRIAVNRELEVLPRVLDAALGLLRPGGRLAVLSYHSLEDRLVKRFVARERRGCICAPELPLCVCGHQPRLRPVGLAPGRPSGAEVAANPRARSARLRAAERLAA
jgi:16S rRNA (cytosine1402-N4)-methyltransferase